MSPMRWSCLAVSLIFFFPLASLSSSDSSDDSTAEVDELVRRCAVPLSLLELPFPPETGVPEPRAVLSFGLLLMDLASLPGGPRWAKRSARKSGLRSSIRKRHCLPDAAQRSQTGWSALRIHLTL